MRKRKTQDEFEKELQLVMPDVKVIGEYINTNTKVKCVCIIHNFEFSSTPYNMLHGHGCRKCGSEKQSAVQTKSHDQFVKDLRSVNPNIEVIGKYKGYKTKLMVKCLIDGYEWNADPSKLLQGGKCPVCTNHKVKQGVNDVATTRPDLLPYFKNKSDAYKYTAGSEKTVEVICPICGYEKSIKINSLTRFNFACNGCYEKQYGKQRMPRGYWNEQTIKEYVSEHCEGYKVVDVCMANESDNGFLKVKLKCPNENHEPYWSYWKNIIDGYRCEQCYLELGMSNGERLAESILNKHNIKFVSQKRFEDCRDKYTLPFDFYLPEYNLIIEIMGEQHEHPVEFFGGEEKFKVQVAHDKFKRQYLSDNNICCLDIWYYEYDNMEDLILDKIQGIKKPTCA